MSVAYEPRSFMHEGTYPPIGDEHDHGADQRFTDSDVAEHLSHYTADAALLQDDRDVLDSRGLLHDPTGADGTRLDLGPTDFSSPLDVPMSAHDMSPTLPDSKDPSPGLESLPSSRIKPIPKPSRAVVKQADGKFHCPLDDCKEDVRIFSRKCEWK
ncbi:hypothetical protein NQ176_g3639 [Zarea fungicola]|uniref:Uncharacterized protein n=1 Tax=Zarea fungicola TaxID=93591 RepID=A0ACC1NIL4_9HYPO|nr:hypothetical protein NQ176_g3639 [Lecanicillium fungicola]